MATLLDYDWSVRTCDKHTAEQNKQRWIIWTTTIAIKLKVASVHFGSAWFDFYKSAIN